MTLTVPMLYTGTGEGIVGDMINFVMLNKPGSCVCIIPRPFGPIMNGVDLFEEYFEGQLTALGVTPHFLDEWYEYHLDGGEIHCGTNQLPRTDSPRPWWLAAPTV